MGDSHLSEALGQLVRTSMRRESLYVRTRKVPKGTCIYRSGDQGGRVYLIERGQVKIVTLTPSGKECLLAVYTDGDIFGELCLAGADRAETASAMRETVLREIPSETFVQILTRDGSLCDFVRYLAARAAEQQQIITHLLTADSEHRLAAALLQLARKLGKRDPRSLRLEQGISHQDLSAMVGTTRPRVTEFMQKFRSLGLIERTSESSLVIKEHRLAEYLAVDIRTRRTSTTINNASF